MDIIHQLSGLVLGSVPTMVFFIVLVTAYGILVGRPLSKALAERNARTSGAVQLARAAISAAESETAVYEEKLRAARNEILAARERRLQQWQLEREAALALARNMSQERVNAARLDIDAELAAARGQIEHSIAEMGNQIIKAVLPAAATFSEVRK